MGGNGAWKWGWGVGVGMEMGAATISKLYGREKEVHSEFLSMAYLPCTYL